MLSMLDSVNEPALAERLLHTLRRTQEAHGLPPDSRCPKAGWHDAPDLPKLVGRSPAIERVRYLIRCIGPTMADVLINGQTGTGKEVVARQLHEASGRTGPFVAINCGALPESMFESEIFGHEAGSFTSAQKRRIGKLEYANGGTVFLDEIETMPLMLQVKLLRVLQERSLERLGGNDPVSIDCRIVAASKGDLLKMSGEGTFRADLYYRIGVVSIDLPRLAERCEDIPLLLAHFVQDAALRYQRPLPQWSAQQMDRWQAREWPGNVRELRNFADRLVLGVGDAGMATAAGMESPHRSLPQRMDVYERMLISDALTGCGGNVAAAADMLGVPKKTLYDKLRKHNLARE